MFSCALVLFAFSGFTHVRFRAACFVLCIFAFSCCSRVCFMVSPVLRFCVLVYVCFALMHFELPAFSHLALAFSIFVWFYDVQTLAGLFVLLAEAVVVQGCDVCLPICFSC